MYTKTSHAFWIISPNFAVYIFFRTKIIKKKKKKSTHLWNVLNNVFKIFDLFCFSGVLRLKVACSFNEFDVATYISSLFSAMFSMQVRKLWNYTHEVSAARVFGWYWQQNSKLLSEKQHWKRLDMEFWCFQNVIQISKTISDNKS